MKIFFLNYNNAGIHDPRGTKIASLLAEKHKVTWIYSEEKEKNKLPRIDFHCIALPPVPFRLKELIYALRASEWVASQKFDAGVGFSHIGGLAAYLAFRKTGAPFVFDYTDPLYPTDEAYAQFYSPGDRWLAKLFEGVEKKALNAAEAVATISPFFKKFLHEKYSVPLSKVFVAPNAPDASLFKPSRKKYPAFTLAYTGKAIPEYGVDWLLECFASNRTSARLLLVVKTEPSWRKWLYGEIKRLKLGKKIVVKENVSPNEVSRLLRKAHAAVFPYPRGRINDYAAPNKFFEYLALGLPVISRDLPEAKRILKEGDCGIVVKNDGEFCNAVKKLKNARIAENLGRNARKLALEKYDWKQVAKEYEKKITGCA